ncbi:F-box only protein 44-like [Anabas testudineus]|uniref:Uncharacterized protein n=1 Tax=Anabas testudineus TaxID=64144 RepID=A0A3Q1JLQ1_ANATE|nr:F-box only protein 44-like [Anabas testudineus]
MTSSATVQSGLFSVPLEILEELFLNLPPEEVVCTCRLVCRQWKEVADSEYLWRERCRRERYHLRDVSRTPKDWRLFYFLCKKRRNLLKNPRAEDQFQDWQILETGYDKWKVEDVRVPHPDERVQKNFVTACQMCKKSQLIDLEREGYNPEFMDHFQPDIKISDWYDPQWENSSHYEICVELLNQNKEPVHTFAPKAVFAWVDNSAKWNQMTHVFQNYGPGVRYIRFTHGGRDASYWGDVSGIRITDSCVEICPSVETQ